MVARPRYILGVVLKVAKERLGDGLNGSDRIGRRGWGEIVQ